MAIITITSDWNDDDYYVAALKGRILSSCPETTIVDLSHKVDRFNTAKAAFIVRNSYGNYPEGSIHLIAVNTEISPEEHLLAASVAGQYFLCADNGFLSLLGDPEPGQVVSIRCSPEQKASSFISWSVFAEAACRIARGQGLEEIGDELSEYRKQVPLRPVKTDDGLQGAVIHIDSYENAITNISRDFFENAAKGRKFRIYIQSRHYVLDEVNLGYHEAERGDHLAIWNSLGLLEIAIREGNAAGLLNLKRGSSIKIEFKEGDDAQY